MYSFVEKEDDQMKRVIWDKEEAALLVEPIERLKPSLLKRMSFFICFPMFCEKEPS
mgnify:FL=1